MVGRYPAEDHISEVGLVHDLETHRTLEAIEDSGPWVEVGRVAEDLCKSLVEVLEVLVAG